MMKTVAVLLCLVVVVLAAQSKSKPAAKKLKPDGKAQVPKKLTGRQLLPFIPFRKL